jgi:F-type H+-transporting ATPase subunit gamma
MESLEKLRSKIDQANDLLSVVKTMKGLAAVQVRQFERAVEGLRAYSDVVERAMQMLLNEQPQAIKSPTTEDSGKILALIYGSDQGLVGQFNRAVLEFATDSLEESLSRVVMFGAGRQVCESIRGQGIPLEENFMLPRSVDGIPDTAGNILLAVENYRLQNPVSRIVLFHNRPTGPATYEPVEREILPLSFHWLESLADTKWPTNNVPYHREDWDTLFSRAIQQHIHIVLLRGLGESLAAENSSRMASMQAAQTNIEDRVGELEQNYHQRRQSAITEELLDVIAGYEATSGPEDY